jgi:sugar phosphate isomerase/epimerase
MPTIIVGNPSKETVGMKIGMSMASYAWVLAGENPPAGGNFMWARPPLDSPEYVWAGLPHPFFFSTPLSFPEGEGFIWLINRCSELDIKVIHGGNRMLRQDPEYRERVLTLLKEKGIELIAGRGGRALVRPGSPHSERAGGMDLVTSGDEARLERKSFAQGIRLAADMGCKIIGTTHAGRSRTNRFTKDPPLERQLDMITENLKHMVEVAEECDVIIAIENHMDYRASEVAEVIERVNSRFLGANFDTANSFAVAEDPVDGAKCLAPYTVMTHLKDFLVQPMSIDGLPKVFGAPLGHGHVDLGTIFDILWKDAPDPENLPHCMELHNPPNVDVDVWVREAVKFLREQFGHYFAS